jgi:hypothetical protein
LDTTMNHTHRYAFFAAHALLCASLSFGAQAQTDAEPHNELYARYQQDLAECEAQQATQDLAACRLEARNALAEAKRNLLSDTTANLFEKNREACEARVRNEGTSTGSVQSGGILREVVRSVPPEPSKPPALVVPRVPAVPPAK